MRNADLHSLRSEAGKGRNRVFRKKIGFALLLFYNYHPFRLIEGWSGQLIEIDSV